MGPVLLETAAPMAADHPILAKKNARSTGQDARRAAGAFLLSSLAGNGDG
jgi:hypothetical protein